MAKEKSRSFRNRSTVGKKGFGVDSAVCFWTHYACAPEAAKKQLRRRVARVHSIGPRKMMSFVNAKREKLPSLFQNQYTIDRR